MSCVLSLLSRGGAIQVGADGVSDSKGLRPSSVTLKLVEHSIFDAGSGSSQGDESSNIGSYMHEVGLGTRLASSRSVAVCPFSRCLSRARACTKLPL